MSSLQRDGGYLGEEEVVVYSASQNCGVEAQTAHAKNIYLR